jgi:hypothetical protein
VEYFHTRVVGMPAEMLEPMKGTAAYDALLAMSPTLLYDGLAMGGDDQSLPVGMLGGLQVPLLAVTSSGTALPWLSKTAEAVAGAVPGGRAVRLEGAFHEVPPPVLAPALAEFYRA